VVGTGTSRQVLYSTRVPRTGTHLLSLNNLKVKKVKKGLLTFKKSTNLPVCTYHIRYIHTYYITCVYMGIYIYILPGTVQSTVQYTYTNSTGVQVQSNKSKKIIN
jgi:hypothetical protein